MAATPFPPSRGRVVGVDAAGKHGWVGVLLDGDGFLGARLGMLGEIIEWAEPVDVVAVDIPIGTIPGGIRRADSEARLFVGPRRSSVFAAPPIDVHAVTTYAEANEALAAVGASKMSQQSWALIPKIIEAATVADSDARVFEIHPEVSFRELAGEPLAWSKKSWNGLLLRRRLLARAGILLPDVIPELASVVADDVVDAAVAAWSARRIAAGTALSFPNPPQDAAGRQMAIWY